MKYGVFRRRTNFSSVDFYIRQEGFQVNAASLGEYGYFVVGYDHSKERILRGILKEHGIVLFREIGAKSLDEAERIVKLFVNHSLEKSIENSEKDIFGTTTRAVVDSEEHAKTILREAYKPMIHPMTILEQKSP